MLYETLLMKLVFPLQLILVAYYPNYYTHDVIHGSWLPLVKQKSSYDPFLLVPALLILVPSLWNVLYKYSFVYHPKFRGGRVARESPNQTCNCSDIPSKCNIHTPAKLPATDIRTGLSSDEVSARRETHGPNQIWLGLNWGLWALNFSAGPAQVWLIIGGVLALTLHDWWHVGPICLLWLLMFSLPAAQTWSASSIAEELCPDVSWPTITLRNGKLQKISTKDLVPGDIVHVSEGLMIPADCIMVACNNLLEVDQSHITGETMHVPKNERNMCFWGTDVVLGEAFLQVENTGLKTFIGRAVNLAHGDRATPKCHKEFASDGEYLAVIRLIGVILLVVLAIPGLLWQTSVVLIESWAEIFIITVDMAIIAGRFFSSSVISCIWAIGSARIAEAGCVVQNKNSLEALAGIDIICVENSGIITENRYILVKPYCNSCDPEAIILAASLSIIQRNGRNAFYRSILRTLRQFPQAKARRDQYEIIDSQDMDYKTGRRYTQCIVEATDGTRVFIASGHPYDILELCQRSAPADHQNCDEALKQAVKIFRDQGLSSLGLCQRQEGENWRLLGVLPFFEPPRQNTKSVLEQAAELGVRVKVMSDRNEVLVERSARAAGIEGSLLRAHVIDDLQLDQNDALAKHINDFDVYTELNVRHREIILETLQDSGHRVAITGRDISHIPALRKADFGIAATESPDGVRSVCNLVCNEAAHGLLPLISAIQESREAYQKAHNHIVRQTVRTLHVLLAMLFVFLTEGKLLDMRLLLMSTNAIELVDVWFGQTYVDAPFQKKPTR